MKNKMKIGDQALATVDSRKALLAKILIGSIWEVTCINKYGKEKWKEINPNVCTAEGINALLDIMFHASTQITTWYILIFESDTTPADGTTYAVPVFTESTAYSEGNRQAFDEAAASSKSITNSASKAAFSINATKTIYGGALVGGGTDADTKDDQAGGGTLFCASKFGSSKSVENGDTLNVQITITGADT